jgi:hypothetical protein
MRQGTRRNGSIALVVVAGLLLSACSSGATGTSSPTATLSAQDKSACSAMEAKITQMNDALAAFSSSNTKATANQLRAVNVAIVNLGAAAQKQAKVAGPALKAQLSAVASKVSPLELALASQGGSVSVTSRAFLEAAEAVSKTCTGQR